MIFLGCSSGVSKEDLNQLNGYWEIEQVVFPGGGEKEYTVNASVDYIQLEGMKGLRKKVRPNFEGTYTITEDAEEFIITEKKGTFMLTYTTELSEWTEELVALDADTFSVVNEDGKQYDYKRFEQIAID